MSETELTKLTTDIEDIKKDIKGLKLYNLNFLVKLYEICNDEDLDYDDFITEMINLIKVFTKKDNYERVYKYYKNDNEKIINIYNMSETKLTKLKTDIEDIKKDINGLKLYNLKFLENLNEVFEYSEESIGFNSFRNILISLIKDFTQKDIHERLYNYYKKDKYFDNEKIVNEYLGQYKEKFKNLYSMKEADEDRTDTKPYDYYENEYKKIEDKISNDYNERKELQHKIKEEENMSVVLGNIMQREYNDPMKKVFQEQNMRGEIAKYMPQHLNTRKKTGGKIRRTYRKKNTLRRRQNRK